MKIISKVELNEIEWITNGERASSLNINRPLKQFLTKYNISIDDIQEALDNFEPVVDFKPLKMKNINRSTSNVTECMLGEYVVREGNVIVDEGLPIGWTCFIVANLATIEVDFGTDSIRSSSLSKFTLPTFEVAKLVKIDENGWLVTIENSVV